MKGMGQVSLGGRVGGGEGNGPGFLGGSVGG